MTDAPDDHAPSAVGGGGDLNEFYRGFRTDEITPETLQEWAHYRVASADWSRYCLTSTAAVPASSRPRAITFGERFDLTAEFREGATFIDSLLRTQVKGFVVMRDDAILAEFYDNGFNLGQTNLLQSAAKTFCGVVVHMVADSGALSLDALVSDVLPDFSDTTIGAATVQQTLDMTSGARQLLEFHTRGHLDQQWEVEIGLQAGSPQGHVEAIRAAAKVCEPGAEWQYSDKNTDALGLVAERAAGRQFADLLADLFERFGANEPGSVAMAPDGSAAPSYGISLTTRDYALFHQWIAQRHAPESYYASATDASKDLIGRNPLAGPMFPGVTYGSQSYFLPDDDVVCSSGSYGQVGWSDLRSGIAVAMHSDWEANAVPPKWDESRERAIAIIEALRDR